MKFERVATDTVHFGGLIDGVPVDLSFYPEPAHRFPLLERGFHLISEAPFNR